MSQVRHGSDALISPDRNAFLQKNLVKTVSKYEAVFTSTVAALLLIIGLDLLLASERAMAAETLPNIVLIYADDLGYGDVSCYGAKAIQTPNVDRLAREGVRFTSGYSPAGTCTPSRYAMLTGEYAWRKPGTGILPGDAALIIEPGRLTLPAMLQKAGYNTALIGKWHLGLGKGQLNWNGEIKPGPLEVGFNYAFFLAATGDRVPCVYIEDRRVVGLDAQDPITVSYGKPLDGPTGKANPELLKLHPSHGHDKTIVNGISRIGYMTGGKAALWKDEEMADVLTAKAVKFIEQKREKPFFLYFATHDPHVPRVPHPRFVGRTALGPRGDVIVQMDWCVGEVLKTLDRLKLTENTLVIFSSDNGPVLDDGYQDDAITKVGSHKPAGPFRGQKYSAFEGGTRVPFLVRWPARVKPGKSEAMVGQIDFFATMAALTGQKLGETDAPDSFNVLPALLGESPKGRVSLVLQGGPLALRDGQWKCIPPRPGAAQGKNSEAGFSQEPQLYNLVDDPGETTNLAGQHPERVNKMSEMLEQIRAQGRSRP
jgi:arylsulfatase A-like enzyme